VVSCDNEINDLNNFSVEKKLEIPLYELNFFNIMATSNVSYQIPSLLEKMTSTDKDFRYMATNDLMTELQKDNIILDDDLERKVKFIFNTLFLKYIKISGCKSFVESVE
jgi:hypothetical protein